MTAFFALFCLNAQAHSVALSVYPEGDKILGEAFFSNGSPVAKADITVSTPDGKALGTARTNTDGEFSFKPEKPVTHIFFIKTGDGHAAKAVLSAKNLPVTLRKNTPDTTTTGTVKYAPTSTEKSQDGPKTSQNTQETPPPALTREELIKLIDYTVGVRTNSLSRKIDQYERDRRLGDILGGIGYIFGIFGFYLLLRRRSGKQPSA